MRRLYPAILLVLTGCAVTDAIEMQQTPLRLTGIEKYQNANGDNLTLEWQSLDGNIRIVTTEPLQDSSQNRIGTVYARCFLRR